MTANDLYAYDINFVSWVDGDGPNTITENGKFVTKRYTTRAVTDDVLQHLQNSGDFSETQNRSALVFTDTPIWVLECNFAMSRWELIGLHKLRRPMTFYPDMYLRDARDNIMGFYAHGNQRYALIVKREHVVFMDIDPVLSKTK